MEFVIDRKTWLRGTGWGSLFDSNTEKQCCIGQICSQLKVDKDQMEDVASVENLLNIHPKLYSKIEVLSEKNKGDLDEKDWVLEAYDINDKKGVSDKTREKKLTDLFKKSGHKLTFDGK